MFLFQLKLVDTYFNTDLTNKNKIKSRSFCKSIFALKVIFYLIFKHTRICLCRGTRGIYEFFLSVAIDSPQFMFELSQLDEGNVFLGMYISMMKAQLFVTQFQTGHGRFQF